MNLERNIIYSKSLVIYWHRIIDFILTFIVYDELFVYKLFIIRLSFHSQKLVSRWAFKRIAFVIFARKSSWTICICTHTHTRSGNDKNSVYVAVEPFRVSLPAQRNAFRASYSTAARYVSAFNRACNTRRY